MRATSTTPVLLSAALLCTPATARAFTVGSQFAYACHEDISLEAYRHYLVDLDTSGVPVPDDDRVWKKLSTDFIRRFNLDTFDDAQKIIVLSLVIGVRAPDTEGHAVTDLANARRIHAAPGGQYDHAVRAGDDDGPSGDYRAMAGTRAVILDQLRTALRFHDAGQEGGLISAPVYLDYYGLFDAPVVASIYHLGRALHALQDSFSHTLRNDSFRRVRHVLNYIEAIAGDLDPRRDGLPHSESLDECRGETRPLVLAAAEASTNLIIGYSAAARGDLNLDEAIGEVLDRWLTVEPGCTADNGYCRSRWKALADRNPTRPYLRSALGCAVTAGATDPRSGALAVAVAALLLVGARRARRVARAAALVALVLVAAGCAPAIPGSFRDEQAACFDFAFEPCGGPIEGAWSHVDSCASNLTEVSATLPGVVPTAACATVFITLERVATGTMIFGPDGHYQSRGINRDRGQVILPLPCLPPDVPPQDACHALAAPLRAQSCALRPSYCLCSRSLLAAGSDVTESALYTTRGSELQILNPTAFGQPTLRESMQYCVRDSILTLHYEWNDEGRKRGGYYRLMRVPDEPER